MAKIIQVRNVPDALHGKLKSRAALEGLSLSGYVMRELERVAERPTMKELAARITSQPPVEMKLSPAQIIREERARRDRVLARRATTRRRS
jgi:plasmid stability protein